MFDTGEVDIETLKEALETINDGIAIYGADEKQLFVNSTGLKRFGKLYEALGDGVPYRDALVNLISASRPSATAKEVDDIVEVYLEKYRNGETYKTTTQDGRTVNVSFHEMSNGRRVGISFDVTDLFEREKELKAAKKDAEQASQSKSAFLANMSHEIRTPLNGIMGMAQVMESTELTDQQRDYMTTILESGKTLMTLLNDVLDLSKIEAGKFDIVPTETDIAHILRRIQRLWKPRAEEKGIELSLALDCELPNFANVDATRMQQCVSNLVSNAIKFTETGRVDVYAKVRDLDAENGLLEIRVSDTGCGMDEETMQRLFKPFAQADETISRAHGGTGLGLSITRHLAQLMGGNAEVESEVGRGSVFTVSFVVGKSNAKPKRRESDTPALEGEAGRAQLKASNLRVLLVDDHPINRQVATLFLRPFNMRIVEAVNGQEALEALNREEFDLVLLDQHMPVMDGPTTIAHIRNNKSDYQNIPVIALTADAMSGDKERYLAMGMDGYLSKPLAERDLLAEISRIRSGVSLNTDKARYA